IGRPASIASCLTTPTSVAASVIDDWGRPPAPPLPPFPPFCPPLAASPFCALPACAAFASPADSDLHATALARRTSATSFLLITRITVIGASGTGRCRRDGDGTTECTRELGGCEHHVERCAGFRRLRGEQCELRVGHFELRAQATREAQIRESER